MAKRSALCGRYQERGDNGPVVSERMARWCAERTTQEAVDTLGGAMIPAGPVLSPQQALDHPHIRATGFMQDVDYPGLPIPAPVVRAARLAVGNAR